MEICTIGGYEEVGNNMTAVKVGEDVIIFDAGVCIPRLIELQEQEDYVKKTEEILRRMKAIPDDLVLDKLGWTKKVKAIIVSHAHLDHVAALPYLAHRYPQAEIIATPFTIEVLNEILEDEKIHIKNKLKKIQPDSKLRIKGKNGDLNFEFVNITHSTIQCVFPIWHTREGTFVYTNDFKFDKHPTMGNPPNYRRLKEIGRKGVRFCVVDSLYADTDRRTASERIARNLLQDAMSNVVDKKSALFITTFSSHIARLKSIVDFGEKTGRQIIFMGRSMNKYLNAAKKANQCPFYNKIKILKYRRQINSFLSKVEKDRGKYLIICTGHQGETGAILDRITNGETPFKFRKGDNIIFSSSVIPAPANINARDKLDKKLRKQGVRLQTDVHVSGHAGREDLRDLVDILKPKHILPSHGDLEDVVAMVDLAKEMGYKFQDNVHLSSNGKVIKI